MYVGGTVISSVEFHGNMSFVIFMSKCPLACRYCHNVELLDDSTQQSFEEIKKEIDDASDFIDAVVISGGPQFKVMQSLEYWIMSINRPVKTNWIPAEFIRISLKRF